MSSSLPRLHSAVLYRQEDKIREYVEAGDDVNATYNGQTCLHFLVYSGAFAGGKDKAEASEDVADIARLVISLGGDVNARDGWGQTPIVWPAQYGTDAPYGYDLVELTNVYVQNGADLENCDKWGYRPIHGCAATGQLQTLRAIITGGADTCSCAAGTKGGVNVTPLMSAIQNKQSQAAMMLLQCGADKTVRSSHYGNRDAVEFARMYEYHGIADMIEGFAPLPTPETLVTSAHS